MILFDLLLWLGVVGYSLLLFVCVAGNLLSLDDSSAGPPRDAHPRLGRPVRRPSDRLPVVLFPDGQQVGGAVS